MTAMSKNQTAYNNANTHTSSAYSRTYKGNIVTSLLLNHPDTTAHQPARSANNLNFPIVVPLYTQSERNITHKTNKNQSSHKICVNYTRN